MISTDDNLNLMRFAARVMKSWPEGDVDGGDLQRIANECGLLHPVTVTEPCGEICGCADLVDFPCNCYWPTPLLTACREADKRKDDHDPR